MTDAELDEMEAMANGLESRYDRSVVLTTATDWPARYFLDVPALITEVRRLRNLAAGLVEA